MTRTSLAAALIMCAAAALGGCGARQSAGPAPGPMPADGFAGVWTRDGGPTVFPGAELYGHIDGGAEVFLELGFEGLEVQRYTADVGEIAVELYRMTDPVAALGIYLMKCGTETPDPSLEARHTAGPDQLQMVRGSSYVSVNVMRSDGDLEPALVDFARHVSEHLPAGEATGVFEALPQPGRVGGSERVIRGPFTLEALYTFGEGDILGLAGTVTAVAAEYEHDGGRFTRIVVPYGDAAAAGDAFDGLAANLDPYLEVVDRGPARLVFSDYAGQFGDVRRDGGTITILVHLSERPD